jgi:hypothetical protein
MDEEIDTLMVEVRASTEGFRSDIETMRGALDTTLVDGFARAGNVLERGLLTAIRRGSLGFDDLERVALQTLNEIAAQALHSGIGSLFAAPGATQGGGVGNLLSGAIGALFGLPGRATGGPVSPGRGYLVGERGPELFVPTVAGRVERRPEALAPAAAAPADRQPAIRPPREVRVSIQLSAPRGTAAPVALRRSSRQEASSVRRALTDF